MSGTPLLVLCIIVYSIFTLSLLSDFLKYLDRVVWALKVGLKLCICWLYLVINEIPVDPMYYLESFPLLMMAWYKHLSKHSPLNRQTTFFFSCTALIFCYKIVKIVQYHYILITYKFIIKLIKSHYILITYTLLIKNTD